MPPVGPPQFAVAPLGRCIDRREPPYVPPLLTPEDFAVPTEFPTIGEHRKDKLHLAVGRAIYQWEFVEHNLGELFATLLGDVVPIGALRVYGLTTGFSARQQMLMGLPKLFFITKRTRNCMTNLKESSRYSATRPQGEETILLTA